MEEEQMQSKKTGKKAKIAVSIISILLLLILSIIMVGSFYINDKLAKINYIELDQNRIQINPEVLAKGESVNTYRTIALFGIDARANTYDKGNRSDCIILAILNEKTKEVSLVSVYRDTYLKMTDMYLDKVTHAYSYGGPELAISTLNTNLDLDIKEFVTVNFDAVVEAVDALGGIELDITEEETKYINGYINEINRVTGHSSEKIKTAGTRQVDGVQALAYSRIRYTAGGDYKRTERMRTVMVKMLQKAKNLNVAELNKIVDILLPKTYTNIEAQEILAMIPDLATYKIKQNIGWPYETKGATINGVWYGVPVNLEQAVTKLHKEIFGQEDYEPSSNVKQISNEIIQKTGYAK